MLFNEIYGSYYTTVAKILTEAVQGTLTEKKLNSIVQNEAFGESWTIPDSLKSGDWPLLLPDYKTPLKNIPSMPLTDIEKRWMKSLLLDPRIKLFSPSIDGLEDVKPLFTPDMICYYDRYTDGDDFSDEEYIARFRLLLDAIHGKRKVKIYFVSRRGRKREIICIPFKLEYSEKDDKFRLIAARGNRCISINLSTIENCEMLERCPNEEYIPPVPKMKTLVLELTDERNALERAMLHFSPLEKETEKLDEKHYRIKLKYQEDDETELVIRVLSFGPLLKVISPESIADEIKQRINNQKSCGF